MSKQGEEGLTASIKGLLALVLAIAVIAFLLGWPILEHSRTRWPEIEHPDALFEDCGRLMEQHEGQEPLTLNRPRWPPSIGALEPINVAVDQDSVAIIMSGGGISAEANGYYIVRDPEEQSTEIKNAEPTKHPHIFKSVW